jgi:hypothetical protein
MACNKYYIPNKLEKYNFTIIYFDARLMNTFEVRDQGIGNSVCVRKFPNRPECDQLIV